MNSINKSKSVAVFAPFAEIDKHSSIEWLVTKSISQFNRVIIIRCGKAFNDLCPSMRLHKISLNSPRGLKSQVCESCITKSRIWDRDLKVNRVEVDYDDLESDPELELLLNAKDHLVHPNEIYYSGIPIGNIAAYDLLIENKILDGRIPREKFSEFDLLVKQSWGVFRFFTDFFIENNVRTLIVFDHLYSLNRAAVEAAFRQNIKVISLGRRPTNNQSEIHVTLDLIDDSLDPTFFRFESWEKFKNLKIKNSILLDNAQKFLIEKTQQGNLWVYSEPYKRNSMSETLEKLKKHNGLKILIVLGSGDERTASEISAGGEGVGFVDQFSWLKHLVGLLTSEDHSKSLIIIRPHPRLFPNMRDSVGAKQFELYMDFFQLLPNRFIIDLPEYKTPIYSILDEIDLVINFSSSIGVESLLWGKPVAILSQHSSRSYPIECNLLLSDDDIRSLKKDSDFLMNNFRHHRMMALKWVTFVRNFTQCSLIEEKASSGENEIFQKNNRLLINFFYNSSQFKL